MAAVHNMSNPTNWFQPYQTNFSNSTQTEEDNQISPLTNDAGATSRNNMNLIPDQGRVAKPIRRRSRASRRTPTTLLNTDPTNFRAMVQHFTGGPSMQQQFATRPQFPAAFGMGNQNVNNVGVGQGSGFHVQYQNQHEQMYMMNNVRGGSGGASSHTPPGQDDESRSFGNYML